MSHFLRVTTDENEVLGFEIAGAVMVAIDEQTKGAINGDEGGTWVPSFRVQIGGAGMVFAGETTLDGVTTDAVSTAAAPIEFGEGSDDDYFAVPFGHFAQSWSLFREFYGSATTQPDELNEFSTTLVPGVRFAVPLRVFSGGVFEYATFSFRVGESHLPEVLPKFRVVAVDAAGNATPLRVAANTDLDGFQSFPTPATAAAWYAAGAVQTFVYQQSFDHVVDVSTYSYYAEIVDESGASAWATTGNTYVSATAVCDGVEIFDGRN